VSFQNVALPRNLVKIYHLYRHVDCGIYTLINFFIFVFQFIMLFVYTECNDKLAGC
jgi:hypothetical protein